MGGQAFVGEWVGCLQWRRRGLRSSTAHVEGSWKKVCWKQHLRMLSLLRSQSLFLEGICPNHPTAAKANPGARTHPLNL